MICPSIDRLPYRFVKCQRQLSVPVPEIKTITKKLQRQVYSSILARIRIFKSLAIPSAYARGPGNYKEISTPGP